MRRYFSECHCELRFPGTTHETWHPAWNVWWEKELFYRLRHLLHGVDLIRWAQMEREEVWRDDPYHGRQAG